MLDTLMKNHNGRELLAKADIEPGEVGVEVSAGNLHGFYAFPDETLAGAFMHMAGDRFMREARRHATASKFRKEGAAEC